MPVILVKMEECSTLAILRNLPQCAEYRGKRSFGIYTVLSLTIDFVITAHLKIVLIQIFNGRWVSGSCRVGELFLFCFSLKRRNKALQ